MSAYAQYVAEHCSRRKVSSRRRSTELLPRYVRVRTNVKDMGSVPRLVRSVGIEVGHKTRVNHGLVCPPVALIRLTLNFL